MDLFADDLAAAKVKVSGDGEREVTGMAIDSRKVRSGGLFAALPGTSRDGHTYVAAALAAGAGSLLVERGRAVAAGATVVETDAVRDVLGPAASRFYGNPSQRLHLFGVTGTNGKTSVTNILEGILTKAGKETGVIGTIEYRWRDRREKAPCTTPEPVDLQRILRAMAGEGVQAAVMEVSSHALAQKRVAGCRFRAAIFTNLSRDHLDYHSHMEEYFDAKALLFNSYQAAVKVANGDDPWGRRLVESCPGTVSFGLGAENDYRAVDIEPGARGLRFRIAGPGAVFSVESRLVGRHNVYNILAAAAAALAYGATAAAVQEGVAAVKVIPGRFEPVPGSTGPLVLIDYAHTPDALEQALKGAREMTAGRLLVLFGCGGDRDRGKRPLMGKAAAELADVTWLTSDNPRGEDPLAIIEQIREGYAAAGGEGELKVRPDRREAIREAIASGRGEDLLLIAGKGHEDYQILGEKRVSFSDRQEAEEALRSGRR